MTPILSLAFAAISPLWFRVGTSPGNEPAFLHLFVYHRASPWFTHANVNSSGLKKGVWPQGGEKAKLKPRTYTPWMDLREIMQDGKKPPSERFLATMVRTYNAPMSNSAFTVEFSLDGTNVCKRFIRKGAGSGMLFTTDQLADGSWRIEQDAEIAARTRRVVEAMPPAEGRAPVLFPLTTGLALDRKTVAHGVMEDEIAIFRALGLNGCGGSRKEFPHCRFSAFVGRGFPHPDPADVLKRVEDWHRKNLEPAGDCRAELVNTGDETGLSPLHMTNCTICAAKVPGGPTLDKTQGLRYYRTMRTLTETAADSLRVVTDTFGRVRPGLPVAVNNATDLVFNGNLVSSGMDWFRIYGTGALTYGWGEDWSNYGRTKQINSIYWDAMRAACLERGIPFGFYNIIAHNEWEIKAKSYSAVGRGARSLHYFDYGPQYAITSDAKSRRFDALASMREFNFALGAVEREVLAARCAKGDAAILLGVTGDLWKAREDNEFGMERSAMSLLLRHCGMRTDILGEEMVARHLGEYPMLFVLDRNVRRDVAKAILDWTRKGGRLYLGPNAMTADEANEPLDLGFVRDAYSKSEKVGFPRFHLVKCKELDRYEGMRVIVGSSKPYFEERNEGRGRILASGFFPGLDYWGSATVNTNRFNMLEYESAHRAFMKKVIAGIPLRCETSNPLVELHLLEGPKADVLALVNWTGARTDVRYTVRAPDGTVRRSGIRRLGAGGFEVLGK